jgi:hypothetical protein
MRVTYKLVKQRREEEEDEEKEVEEVEEEVVVEVGTQVRVVFFVSLTAKKK